METSAAFSQPGIYVLRLTADDSELTGSDTLTVTVRLNRLPDFDGDDDVDMEDFGYFQACFSGSDVPYPSGCELADLDDDNDVDPIDFTYFKPCLAGPNRPPGC